MGRSQTLGWGLCQVGIVLDVNQADTHLRIEIRKQKSAGLRLLSPFNFVFGPASFSVSFYARIREREVIINWSININELRIIKIFQPVNILSLK